MYEGLDNTLKSDYSTDSYSRAKSIVNEAYRYVSTVDDEVSQLLIWAKEYDMSLASSGELPSDFRKMYSYRYTDNTVTYEGHEAQKYETKYDPDNAAWFMYDMDGDAIEDGTIRYFYMPADMSATSDTPAAPAPIHDLVYNYALFLGLKDDGEDQKEINNQASVYENSKQAIIKAYNPSNFGRSQFPKDVEGNDIYDIGKIW